MRPAANFTLHAILAACLVAFAATSAAAAGPGGDHGSVGFFQMRLGTTASGERGQHLEVQSYQWAVPPSAVKPDRNYVKSWSTSGDAESAGGGADVVMKGSKIGENSAAPTGGVTGGAGDVNNARTGHSMLGASERVTVSGGRTETPPPGKGSVWIRVSSPWAGCKVGARYPSLTLEGRGKSYLLEDVRVASCGGPREGVSFSYAKVKVRGWDPEKIEE
jgi:hypothetical protein